LALGVGAFAGEEHGRDPRIAFGVVDLDLEAQIRETWELWNAGIRDPDAMGQGLTDDFELSSALTGRTFFGRHGLIDWMAEIDENFDAWNLRIDEIRPAGEDRFLVLGGVHLHGRGSGVEFDQPIGWVVEFEKGLTRRLFNFASHEEAIEAVEAG
jgi:SnoaL-like domain